MKKLMNLKDNYEDALNIFNSLSKKERIFVANDVFDDNPFVVYRKVLKENDEPVSFLELYDIPETKNAAYIVVATKEKYRKKGYIEKLVLEAEEYNKKNKIYEKLIWNMRKGNDISAKVAQKLGYQFRNNSTLILEKSFQREE